MVRLSPIESPTLTIQFSEDAQAHLRDVLRYASQPTTRLELTQRRKVWRFPKERFVTYEPSDESWCRYFGIGREIEVVEKLEIPNAIITDVSECGVTFQAQANGSNWLF